MNLRRQTKDIKTINSEDYGHPRSKVNLLHTKPWFSSRSNLPLDLRLGDRLDRTLVDLDRRPRSTRQALGVPHRTGTTPAPDRFHTRTHTRVSCGWESGKVSRTRPDRGSSGHFDELGLHPGKNSDTKSGSASYSLRWLRKTSNGVEKGRSRRDETRGTPGATEDEAQHGTKDCGACRSRRSVWEVEGQLPE